VVSHRIFFICKAERIGTLFGHDEVSKSNHDINSDDDLVIMEQVDQLFASVALLLEFHPKLKGYSL